MRQGLYVVFDSKVGLFSMPFFAVSDPGAARSFGDALKQEGSLMQRHPEDFSLVRLADVDDTTGQLTTPVSPVEVANGRTLLTHLRAKEADDVR